MTIGFILQRVAGNPNDLGHAQHTRKLPLDLAFAPARISVRIQKTGLSGNQRPLSVDCDAASFRDHLRLKSTQPEMGEQSRSCLCVISKRFIVTAPSIKSKTCRGYITLIIDQKIGSVIPKPAIINRDLHAFNIVTECRLGNSSIAWMNHHRYRLES